MLSPPARLPPAPVLDSPDGTRLDGAGANALAGGQLLRVVIFLGLWVPHLIRVPQAPAVHEDLTVTAGSLGHQTLAQGGGSRCLQVAITRLPSGDRYSRTRACGRRSSGGTRLAWAG